MYFFQFPLFVPLSLALMLNLNISKVVKLNPKQCSKECILHMYPLGTYFAYLTAAKSKDNAIDSMENSVCEQTKTETG